MRGFIELVERKLTPLRFDVVVMAVTSYLVSAMHVALEGHARQGWEMMTLWARDIRSLLGVLLLLTVWACLLFYAVQRSKSQGRLIFWGVSLGLYFFWFEVGLPRFSTVS